MNKLIDLQIANNELILKFDNGGYIKINNLHCFDYKIRNCDSEINYLKFFEIEQEDYRFICANNNKAILIDLNDSNFLPDDDENWHAQFYENVNNFLEAYFIVNNVDEYKKDEDVMRTRLRDVFEEINKEEIEKACEKNELIIKNNINKILNEIKAKLNKDEFNFVIAYLMGNYDFEALKDGLKINVSKSLKTAIRNHVKNIIISIFEKHNLDISIYDVTLIQKFSPPLKSKRLIYKFEAEQIGADHKKSWQISNFSFSTTNNGGNNERTN